MRARVNIWLVLVPWVLIIIFGAIALAGDYGQFQQDKSQQQSDLLALQKTLSALKDSWEEQGITVFEQFREAEEKRSIEEHVGKLEANTRAAKADADALRQAQFFPEAVDAAYDAFAELAELQETIQSAFNTQAELIEVRKGLMETPARVRFYRDRVIYWSSRDIINYYFAQDALAQSESHYYEMQLLAEQLGQEMDRWREQFDHQRLACADRIEQMGEAVAHEAKTDYLSYLLARLRTFNPRRAAGF
jgi:hypothetical protein